MSQNSFEGVMYNPLIPHAIDAILSLIVSPVFNLIKIKGVHDLFCIRLYF